MNRFKLIAISLIFISACATSRVVYRTDYDFSRIKRIYIKDFKSAENYAQSGPAIKNEFIKEFIKRGISVTENISDADAVMDGSVLTFQPERKYLIVLPKPGEKKIVAQQMVEISGSNIYTFGSAFGLKEDNQIIVSNATVGISAILKDASSGVVVWSNSYTYEGLDLATALEGAVKYIVRSIPIGNKK